MFTIICIMAAGFITGRFFRKRDTSFVQKLTTMLIWVLLFLLGVEVGGNETIVTQFGSLGIQAFVLTIAGLAGSTALAWLLWRRTGERGRKEDGR